jgi:hypothetical protein
VVVVSVLALRLNWPGSGRMAVLFLLVPLFGYLASYCRLALQLPTAAGSVLEPFPVARPAAPRYWVLLCVETLSVGVVVTGLCAMGLNGSGFAFLHLFLTVFTFLATSSSYQSVAGHVTA